MSDYERDAAGALVLDDAGEPKLTAEAAAAREQATAAASTAALEAWRKQHGLADDGTRPGDALEQRARAAEEQSAAAVGAYRELALKSNPSIPPELVKGGTIDEVNAAIASASAIVDSIRARLAEEAQASTRPPLGFATGGRAAGAGAPANASPSEKIRAGLAERGA